MKRYFQNDEFIVISEPNGAINTIEGYVPKLMRQLESMEEKLDKKTKLIDSFVKGVTSEMARSPKVALKKKLLMSEIEADEFILKTVFNLTVVKEDE